MRSSRDGRAASPVTVRDQVEMVEPGRCSWSCFIQPNTLPIVQAWLHRCWRHQRSRTRPLPSRSSPCVWACVWACNCSAVWYSSHRDGPRRRSWKCLSVSETRSMTESMGGGHEPLEDEEKGCTDLELFPIWWISHETPWVSLNFNFTFNFTSPLPSTP